MNPRPRLCARLAHAFRILYPVLAGLALNAGWTANLATQALPPQPGARIRVLANAVKPSRYAEPVIVEGDLVSITSDTLFLTPTRSGARSFPANRPLAVPASSIRYLAERIGRRSAWRTGGIIGGIAGGVAGVVIAENNPPEGCTGDCDPYGMGAVAGLFLGALGGAVIGSIIAAPFKLDHWREVPIERVHVGFGYLESSTVGLSFRF